MASWITAAECEERFPGWLAARGENGWRVDVAKRCISSRFGFAEVRVQLNQDGTPAFDRVVCGEAPNINAVAYYVKDGVWYIGVTFQVRPFADLAYGVPADPPIKFAQPVMGFRDKIVGKVASAVFESAPEGAKREVLEEAGVNDVMSIQSMGQHWGNPTGPLVTPTDLLEIQVNPESIDTSKLDREELIYKCEYLSTSELVSRIASGEHDGVNYRASVAMNTFFVFFARHPEALAQATS
ncbi:MAG: hypothetical protein A2958_01880 [Candidatus Levybacteria bacterium RIFCSPLOWO2_01_FULL_38_13]|nr:MAG: hypothetical protein A2629_02635 [Candidatus Levybacteria bacterium RIFCSPHIGHO2_01_FULL_41_15]OGH35706.1 MAG: hypothetical protein A2958_01880 [Candidatus Levybacteria bacterium RIFCSPLOWO2_01_FULL_38_13]